MANFQPEINRTAAHQFIDEDVREAGLRDLRKSNFSKLLSAIKPLKSTGGRLLDVGCAYGWFLESAKNDFDVLGLEPDQVVFEVAARRGLPVRMGYFPDALYENEKFDVIVFNDVFEHIPDVQRTIMSCREHCKQDGLLMINLPNSRGLFYRIAKYFCHLGYSKLFERMWQKDLPSPHLHYFSRENLIDLLKGNGFDVELEGRLPAIQIDGLYKRLSYTGNLGLLVNTLLYVGVVLSIPMLRILPSDIIFIVAKRRA